MIRVRQWSAKVNPVLGMACLCPAYILFCRQLPGTLLLIIKTYRARRIVDIIHSEIDNLAHKGLAGISDSSSMSGIYFFPDDYY